MTLGENLRNARKKAGLTQAELAEQCEIATITIRQYESNRREPRLEQLQHIARALDVDWVDLVPEDGQSSAAINSMKEKSKAPSKEDSRTIWSNTTPDPEWAELHKKLEDNTITPEELERYKALWIQGMDNARAALSPALARLRTHIEKLNASGQQKVEAYAEDLARIPEYQATPSDPSDPL